MNPFDLSGWVLPSGEYQVVEEWWHVSHLYDLKAGGQPELQSQECAEILSRGDESEIRDMASKLGFVKISRGEIDAYSISNEQLVSLQAILELCDPEFEFRLLIKGGESIRPISVARLLKLRSALKLFEE
jgi:hypothetical protein